MRQSWRDIGATSGPVVFLLIAIASFPSVALGSSTGELTRVQVSANWTHGSLAGTAARLSGCVRPPEGGPGSLPPKQPQSAPWECGWIAYATVGPGSSPGDCASPDRRLAALGPGVQLLWSSEELLAPGSAAFDLPDVNLEFGEAAPLLCLSAVEAVAEGLVCTDDVESDCPAYAIWHQHFQLAGQLLHPESQSIAAAPTAGIVGSAASHPSPPCRKPKLRRRQTSGRHTGRATTSVKRRTAVKVRKGRCTGARRTNP